MVITHVIYSFQTGGIETMLVDIMQEQCKTASVSLIVINDRVNNDLINSIDKRITIFLLNRAEGNKLQLISTLFKLNKIINSINPDVIHCHNYNLFPFFFQWSKKTCLTVHNVNLPTEFLKKFRKVFSISKAVQKDIKDRIGLDSIVVYNGIKVEEYNSRIDYTFNPSLDVLEIVQVSRLLPVQKGQDIAIKAIFLFKEKYPEANLKLYFIGEGDALTGLKELVSSFNLDDSIVFLEQKTRDWIKTHLCDYKLLIQPSVFEGFGLTIVEGFSAGLPVIASKVDGPEEILDVLHAGLFVNPGDPEDLAEKIHEIYRFYSKKDLENSNSLILDKKRLSIFDVKKTAQNYIDNYNQYILTGK